MKVVIYEAKDADEMVHFSGLSQEEVKRFSQTYYSEHGIALEIYEMDRETTDHTRKIPD